MTVLLDTAAIYAMLSEEDANHGVAKDLFLRLAHSELGTPFVSDWVIAELFTLIRSRGARKELEEAAHRLLAFPDPGLPSLRLLTLAPPQLEDVWKAYEKHRAARISFTDAAQLVLMRAFGIDRLATFDKTLAALANPAAKK